MLAPLVLAALAVGVPAQRAPFVPWRPMERVPDGYTCGHVVSVVAVEHSGPASLEPLVAVSALQVRMVVVHDSVWPTLTEARARGRVVGTEGLHGNRKTLVGGRGSVDACGSFYSAPAGQVRRITSGFGCIEDAVVCQP